VAGLPEHGQVMADDDQADLALADQASEQAEDLGLHDDVERRGRLVGDDQVGLAGQRHGDHDPLALAAGQLVGVACLPPGRHADAVEQLGRPRVGLPAAGLLVQHDGLADLLPDRADRVERTHRALEDHGRAGPAHRAQLLPAEGDDVLALEQDLPVEPGGGGQQPQQAERHGRLAAAGLPRHPECLAGLEAEADAADGADGVPAGAVGHRQVAHLEQGPPGRHACPAHAWPGRRGLRMFSTARPTSVKPSTTIRMAMPGGRTYHQAPRVTAPWNRAWLIIEPQDTSIGLPSPRKASVVSDKIAPATVSVLETRMNGATFGRTWRTTSWPSRAPRALARSMNGRAS